MSTGYILIIDDDPVNSQHLAGQLTDRGYVVKVAAEWLTALRLLESITPDLIVLNERLPDISSDEVYQLLKDHEKTCPVPVVFLKNLSGIPDQDNAFAVGGADLITQPMPMPDFLMQIEHLLHLRRVKHALRWREQEKLHQQNQQLIAQNQQLIEQNQYLQQEIKERDRTLAQHQQAETKLAQGWTFLRRISTRLSTLISSLQSSILVEDESRQIVLVNQSFCDLFSIPALPSELIGTDCSQAAAQTKALFAEPDQFVARVCQILQERQIVVAEEIQLADNRTVERDYIPIFQAQEYQGHLWQYRDITARKATEIELRAKTQALADFSNNLKHLHRLNMTGFESLEALFADYIQTGCTVLGFSAGAIGRIQGQRYTFLEVQSKFEQLVPNLTINLQDAFCGKVSECRKTVAFHHVAQLEDMRCHPLYQSLKLESYLGTPIFVDGELFGTLCFFSTQARLQKFENHEREIIELMAQSIGRFISIQHTEATQRQIKEAALQEAARSANANRTKSEFLANMSHELRTPLNAILGFTQLMARERSLSPTSQEYLAIIGRSGEHLLNLINDVLEMSKIEAGQIVLHANAFDLYYLLQNLEEMLQLKAESKGLHLIFHCDSTVPRYIQTDEGKLRQVLINLLGNAIKFTEEGSVALHVTVDHASFPSLPPVCTLFFEVKDTGSGIAPEELESLFEPFVRSSNEQQHEGTGLGLPISRKFVQLMGGDISVSSVLSQGTQVQFNLQVQLAQPTDMRRRQPQRRAIALVPGQAPCRILVVEDHPVSRQLLVSLLRSLKFDVREAADGATAIAIWQEWHPHLIWMDMRMPVMNGFEATRQIRAQERAREHVHPPILQIAPHDLFSSADATKIIALTASAFEEDREKVLSAGCNDFVRKPFREDVILEKITDHLGVQYIYEEDNDAATIPVGHPSQRWLTEPGAQAFSLQIMPLEWIKQVHQAAVLGSDGQLLQLIKQIPANQASLANTLIHWVNNFQFERLLTLTQVHLR